MLKELFSPIDGAIFDMDGTLLDSMDAWRRAPVQYMKEQGLLASAEDELDLLASSFSQQAAYFQAVCGGTAEERDLLTGSFPVMEQFYRNEVEEKPGADRFLACLRERGVALYVASATPGSLVRLGLERVGLLEYFSDILSAWDMKTTKRRPDIFLEAQHRMGLPAAGRIWVFEDALYSICTAKQAGFRVAAVEDPSALEEREEIRAAGDLWIPSYEKLLTQE